MIEWVDNKKIYVHIDKHVIGNKVESSKWKNMYYVKNYGNYDEIVREYENGSKEELSNYYVNSSHDVINNSESEYLYLDTFGNTSLNFKRKAEDSDLTTCTQVFDRRLKIVSCFFKDDLIKHFDIFFLIKNLHFDYKGEIGRAHV